MALPRASRPTFGNSLPIRTNRHKLTAQKPKQSMTRVGKDDQHVAAEDRPLKPHSPGLLVIARRQQTLAPLATRQRAGRVSETRTRGRRSETDDIRRQYGPFARFSCLNACPKIRRVASAIYESTQLIPWFDVPR